MSDWDSVMLELTSTTPIRVRHTAELFKRVSGMRVYIDVNQVTVSVRYESNIPYVEAMVRAVCQDLSEARWEVKFDDSRYKLTPQREKTK